MGRDTVQLETMVNTISQEYLLEFTSEYGIPKALHPELPGPEDRIIDFPEGKVDERVFSTIVDCRTSAPKDAMPAESTYSLEAVRALDTHHMELFNLIRAPNPTKVKTGSRPRVAHEVPFLTLTANRVVEIEDTTAATDSSGVPSTIERSPLDFANEAGASNQGTMAPEVPPPKDVPATSAPEAGQAKEVAATDPSAATKSRKRGRDGADVNAPPNVLRRDDANPRPTGSTRGGKSHAAIELGMASTRPVHVPEDAPAGVSDPDPLSFSNPRSRHPADVAQSSQGTAAAGDPESENASFASAVGSPETYFSELRHLHNDDFLRQYNVNLARQVAMGSQLRLRFEQEKSVAQVAHRDKRIQARELEIKNLEALLGAEADIKKAAEDKSARLSQELEDMRALFSDLQVSNERLSQQVATLQEQVSGEVKLKAAFEEFKLYEDSWVEQRCSEMDARLDALSIDFDEELYPHMLTAIAGRRWMIGRGLRFAVMKCGESLELMQAFADVVSAGIAKGMSEGLRHEALKDLKYPLVDQLEGLKDAPMDVIMAALYLKSDTGMMLHNIYVIMAALDVNADKSPFQRTYAARSEWFMGNDRTNEKTQVDNKKVKTAIACLYQALPEEQSLQITKHKTAKAIWDALKTRHIGEERVQQARLQILKSDFEMLHMKEDETIDTFTKKLTTLVNKVASLGHTMEDETLVRKLLNVVPDKYLQIVVSIEQYSDLSEMTLEEAIGRLKTYEERIKYKKGKQVDNQKKLMFTRHENKGKYFRGRGHSNEEKHVKEVEEQKVSLHEEDVGYKETNMDSLWYLNNRASNHMTRVREHFKELDEKVSGKVRFRDGSYTEIKGKGSILIECDDEKQRIISHVYYIPSLKSNLLSLGQFTEIGCKLVMEDDKLRLYDMDNKIFMKVTQLRNQLYKANLRIGTPVCLLANLKDDTWLWHARLGHLNFESLRSMAQRDLVHGIPSIKHTTQICDVCLIGKHSRASFPKKAKARSTSPLDLVYGDLCGPITPPTPSRKKYIFLLVNDYSRYMWVYFLSMKDQAFDTFNEYKKSIENELRTILKMLRMDRGREFTSNEFTQYSTNMQQDFWAEAVRHAIYILNSVPTKALEDITPHEAIKRRKPNLENLRVCGCITYAKVPSQHLTKLDDRSSRMVYLGNEQESKAYRLFDPTTQRICVSRDVKFKENETWDWKEYMNFKKCALEQAIYTKTSKDLTLLIGVYVDDLIITGTPKKQINKFKAQMEEKFKMSDLGLLAYYLGIEVTQIIGDISIKQSAYANKILKEAGIRFIQEPQEQHMKAIRQVLRYVKGTKDYGITYKHNGGNKMHGFSDSSYGVNTQEGKGTTGIIFYYGESPISWSTQKQATVALSSCESEFIAATAAATQALWLKRLLSKLTHSEEEKVTIRVDNKSAIALMKNLVFHGRSKHIDTKYHFIRECVEREDIQVKFVSEEYHKADILTKALPKIKFLTMRQLIGLKDLQASGGFMQYVDKTINRLYSTSFMSVIPNESSSSAVNSSLPKKTIEDTDLDEDMLNEKLRDDDKM
nr:zinc finger, CCHC-type [Tanacetum cinerariifolium]